MIDGGRLSVIVSARQQLQRNEQQQKTTGALQCRHRDIEKAENLPAANCETGDH
jgi:hypothetical protein